jgi:hypothetical protein
MDVAFMPADRVREALQIQATVTVAHETGAAVVAALNDVKRNAGKR